METPYTDKERLMDSLSSQKFVTGVYNTGLNECATPEVIATMSGILNEEHEIQNSVWRELNSRGWYPVEPADDNKLNSAKQKYCAKQ